MIDYGKLIKRIETIKERMEHALNMANATSDIEFNTYGHGFDTGVYEGLREAYCIMKDVGYKL
jgi:hypothetical protein